MVTINVINKYKKLFKILLLGIFIPTISFANFLTSSTNCSRANLASDDSIAQYNNIRACISANYHEAAGLWAFYNLTIFDTKDGLLEAHKFAIQAAEKGDKLGIATLASLHFLKLNAQDNLPKEFIPYPPKLKNFTYTDDLTRTITSQKEYDDAINTFNYNLTMILKKTYNNMPGLISNKSKQNYWDFISKEADKGDLVAILALANATKEGNKFIKKDYKKSLKLFLKASEVDSKDAFLQLSEIYEQGLGVNKDQNKATMYYQKAKQ